MIDETICDSYDVRTLRAPVLIFLARKREKRRDRVEIGGRFGAQELTFSGAQGVFVTATN